MGVFFTGRFKSTSKCHLSQDSRVSVHFQENGWVDTKTAVNIAKVMQQDPAFVNPDENRTFLCDNLQSHKAPEFVDSMKSLGEIVLFPPNVTDLLQPGMYFVHLDFPMLIVVDSRCRRRSDDEISDRIAA